MTKKQKKNSEGSDISNSSLDFVAWKCPGLVLFQKKIASPGIYTGNNNDNNNSSSSSSSLKC
jgi:hypothetical protein